MPILRWSFAFVSTRRKFLLDCAALMAAGLASPAAMATAPTAPFWRKRPLQEISCSALASQVDTGFLIHTASGGTIRVTLVEMKMGQEKPLKPGRRASPDRGNEKFSLFFSGSRIDLLEQNTYTVAHESLGRFDLFLVPICTRDPDKIDYQAVINRPGNHTIQDHQTIG